MRSLLPKLRREKILGIQGCTGDSSLRLHGNGEKSIGLRVKDVLSVEERIQWIGVVHAKTFSAQTRIAHC